MPNMYYAGYHQCEVETRDNETVEVTYRDAKLVLTEEDIFNVLRHNFFIDLKNEGKEYVMDNVSIVLYLEDYTHLLLALNNNKTEA